MTVGSPKEYNFPFIASFMPGRLTFRPRKPAPKGNSNFKGHLLLGYPKKKEVLTRTSFFLPENVSFNLKKTRSIKKTGEGAAKSTRLCP